MAKKTIRINIKLPRGVVSTPELEAAVNAAADKAVHEHIRKYSVVQSLAQRLNREGFDITPEELLERHKGTGSAKSSKKSATIKPPSSAKKGKRVVLTDGQRAAVIEALKAGAKTKTLVEKYGASPATIANIKRDNGLTNPRKK